MGSGAQQDHRPASSTFKDKPEPGNCGNGTNAAQMPHQNRNAGNGYLKHLYAAMPEARCLPIHPRRASVNLTLNDFSGL
jgi:hypothetical protein